MALYFSNDNNEKQKWVRKKIVRFYEFKKFFFTVLLKLFCIFLIENTGKLHIVIKNILLKKKLPLTSIELISVFIRRMSLKKINIKKIFFRDH